jgi:hypothetical protein
MFNDLYEHILKEDDFEAIFQPASAEELEERLMDYIKSVCHQNSDGTWSSDGDVYISSRNLTKLPVQFKEVKGYFDCSANKLTSLEGAPRSVGGCFWCQRNKLTTLEGAPENVGGSFYCYCNKLTTLQGAPERVGGYFYCYGNLVSVAGLKKTISRDYSNRIR